MPSYLILVLMEKISIFWDIIGDRLPIVNKNLKKIKKQRRPHSECTNTGNRHRIKLLISGDIYTQFGDRQRYRGRSVEIAALQSVGVPGSGWDFEENTAA